MQIPTLLVFQLVPPEFLVGRKHLGLLRWVFARPHIGAVAVCGENRSLLVDKLGLPQEKVTVVYNGSKTSRQCAPDDLTAGGQLISKLGLDSASPLVCCAGRLCFQKGYDLVVPVLPHLREEFPDLRCLWLGAGEPDYEARLKTELSNLGVRDMVVMPGAVDHVPGVLARADVFLFPSRFEGHSLALTEAMAAGLPIVTSDASGIPEVIRHGREGLIFRKGDSCDLMEKLRWALRHPQEMRRMAAAAQERQREFTEEQMVEETLRAMERVAAGEAFA
jgi:glycosyltransferase involved in cell wall biosynthesis